MRRRARRASAGETVSSESPRRSSSASASCMSGASVSPSIRTGGLPDIRTWTPGGSAMRARATRCMRCPGRVGGESARLIARCYLRRPAGAKLCSSGSTSDAPERSREVPATVTRTWTGRSRDRPTEGARRRPPPPLQYMAVIGRSSVTSSPLSARLAGGRKDHIHICLKPGARKCRKLMTAARRARGALPRWRVVPKVRHKLPDSDGSIAP